MYWKLWKNVENWVKINLKHKKKIFKSLKIVWKFDKISVQKIDQESGKKVKKCMKIDL